MRVPKWIQSTVFLMTRVVLCVLLLSVAACGDDDGDSPDAGEADAAAVDGGLTPDGEVLPDGGTSTGEATELTVDLHSSNQYAYDLSELLTLPGYTGTDWDVSVTNAMPNPPTFLLGPGVTAVNLGGGAGFHDVTEAPAAGYDDDDPDAIIGIAWQDGGTGATGFEVTGNIYVLMLADSTYAKLEVLSAQQGVVTVRVYRQADGTRNLSTAP